MKVGVLYMSNNCFVSWSGGKDSCLALYKAIEKGYKPKRLLTMFSIESGISTAHRLKENIIKAQASSIGIEYNIGRASFTEYEKVFVENLKRFKDMGIDFGIFGDIDIEDHREWEDRVCKKASIKAVLPLWHRNRRELVEEFINYGFKAKIVLVDKTRLDTRFIGEDLSLPLIRQIEKYGLDACGENGEYHTVVYDGPIFNKPLDLKYNHEIITVEDRWAQIEVNI